MKRWTSILLVLLLLFSAGCPSLDSIRNRNREKLLGLSVGMSKSDVLRVMGTGTVMTDTFDYINNPYRVETLTTSDAKVCELLFYYTDIKSRNGAITDDELTPLVIEDGVLVGWGWSFLNQNVERYHYQIDLR